MKKATLLALAALVIVTLVTAAGCGGTTKTQGQTTTPKGKGVFPESHPLSLWPGFGDAAPPFARDVAASCDATLAIGCRFAEVATGS